MRYFLGELRCCYTFHTVCADGNITSRGEKHFSFCRSSRSSGVIDGSIYWSTTSLGRGFVRLFLTAKDVLYCIFLHLLTLNTLFKACITDIGACNDSVNICQCWETFIIDGSHTTSLLCWYSHCCWDQPPPAVFLLASRSRSLLTFKIWWEMGNMEAGLAKAYFQIKGQEHKLSPSHFPFSYIKQGKGFALSWKNRVTAVPAAS